MLHKALAITRRAGIAEQMRNVLHRQAGYQQKRCVISSCIYVLTGEISCVIGTASKVSKTCRALGMFMRGKIKTCEESSELLHHMRVTQFLPHLAKIQSLASEG